MLPMDYEEFLWATGKEALPELLRQCLSSKRALGEAAHRQMMRDFRLYMLVGGMPQAISAYIDTNDFSIVDQTKRRIIDLYESDFIKIDTSGRISSLFDAIPAQLVNNISRYKPHAVAESDSYTMQTMNSRTRKQQDCEYLLSFHCPRHHDVCFLRCGKIQDVYSRHRTIHHTCL